MPGQKEGFVKVWRLRVLFRCKKNNLCGLEACCCSRLHVGFSNKHTKRRDSDKQSDKNNCNHSLPRLITTRKMNSHKTCLYSKAWTPLTVKQGNTWLTKQKQVETQCCWADLLTAAAAKATAPASPPPLFGSGQHVLNWRNQEWHGHFSQQTCSLNFTPIQRWWQLSETQLGNSALLYNWVLREVYQMADKSTRFRKRSAGHHGLIERLGE